MVFFLFLEIIFAYHHARPKDEGIAIVHRSLHNRRPIHHVGKRKEKAIDTIEEENGDEE